MTDTLVRITERGPVSTVLIDRPRAMNALSFALLEDLQRTIAELAADAGLRAVILTGAGEKAFVAGADIAEMRERGPARISEYIELGQRVMRSIETLSVPVIAAVNGYALGGGLELALSCDLIIAARTAKVGQPEVNLGIIPGFGGTQRLIQRAGLGTTRRLCYTGEIISAEEALRLGVVDNVTEPAELQKTARATADLVAAKAPLAIRGAKRVIRASQEALFLSGLRLEVEEFERLFATADREEGMAAFTEKRPAKFQSR